MHLTRLLMSDDGSSRMRLREFFGLISAAESKTGKMDEKVAELQEWLQPMKSIVAFNIDAATVQELVLQLKQYTDDMSEIPKGVVTILRILKYMAIGPEFKDAGKTKNRHDIQLKV